MSVYFAAVGGYIKIGFSDNPERRVARLFRGSTLYNSPQGAYLARGTQKLIRTIEGDKSVERGIHIALEDFMVKREWAVDEAAVRSFIAAATDWTHTYAPVVRDGGSLDFDWSPNDGALAWAGR